MVPVSARAYILRSHPLCIYLLIFLQRNRVSVLVLDHWKRSEVLLPFSYLLLYIASPGLFAV